MKIGVLQVGSEWIEENAALRYVDFQNINLTYNYGIYEQSILGENSSADRIRQIYAINATMAHEIEAELRNNVQSEFNRTVDLLYPNKEINITDRTVIINKTSLTSDIPGSDIYHPPVFITVYCWIIVSPDYFNLPEEAKINDAVYGTLKMGAHAIANATMSAPPGHNVSVSMIPPKDISFRDENHTEPIHWTINNWIGSNNITETHKLIAYHLSPIVNKQENIANNVNVDLVDFDRLYINVTSEVYAVEVSTWDMLPNQISNLTVVSADGIRMVVDNKLTTWDNIYTRVINATKLDLERLFVQGIQYNGEPHIRMGLGNDSCWI